MRLRQWLAAGVTIVGTIGASAVMAQRESFEAGGGPRTLDPGTVAVRLFLGVGDTTPSTWDGKVALDRGEVLGVEGYRFREGDLVTGRDSWKAKTRLIRKEAPKAKAAAIPKTVGGPSTYGATLTHNGVVVSLKAPEDATLRLETGGLNVAIRLGDLSSGRPRVYGDGRIIAQRVAPSVPLLAGPPLAQEDFPAAVSDGQGGAWVAYVVHEPRGPEVLEAYTQRPANFAALAPSGGGDQVKLLHFTGGRAGDPVDVTSPGRDVWRPALAIDFNGDIVVAWSENVDGNFDLYRRRYDSKAKTWSDTKRLTTNPGTDTDCALAAGPDGAIALVWQSWEDGRAKIRLGDSEKGETDSQIVSAPEGNAWSPAVAVDAGRQVYVAYDTYVNGNYDVMFVQCGTNNLPKRRLVIAGSPRYETRPSLAVASTGRIWVAYEERTENWGKDAENLVTGVGSALYKRAVVKVKCVEGDRILEVADPVADATQELHGMNSFPRLVCDPRGRVWLAFRHRQEVVWGQNAVMVAGGVWVEYVAMLAGTAWSPPTPLPRSDGLLDNRPALVAGPEGPLWLFYTTDGRLHREVEFTPERAWRYYSHSGTPPGDINNDLFVAAVSAPAGALSAGEPSALQAVPQELAPPVVHADEPGDVARMRAYRVNLGGKSYRLFRGDFHRHTEVSQDGGADGALEDMWRYAIDAAGFDWMGNADHDNGGGKEYTWWLVQKSTDLYQSPKLVTLFSYERSVAYPHGHRNVMFAKRGIRTLPRLVENGQVVDADTLMLYNYLREHGGICASHTSATGMGTDWRDTNPTYEPFVEIYQGHRNSYEHLGAPRVARRPGEAIGGWRPLGMVWNALASQYRVGFQASSDHISTHISYAIAVAEQATRESVLDAFRRRHCYGATDNIVMDVRSGEHMMGDEFDAASSGGLMLNVLVHGTRPIKRVDVIKDFIYVFSTEPNRQRVEFTWTDSETRGPGLSWYYVRAIQDNGELAWASPMWVRSVRDSVQGQ
jgi:hypothetical protein